MNIQPIDAATAQAAAARAAPAAVRQPGPAVQPPVTGEPRPIELAQVREAALAVHAALQSVARDLHFAFDIDEQSGKIIVKVSDARTREVIRQIPAEEVLAMSRAMRPTPGLLLERQA